jgi:hypothetical protein
MYIEPKLEPLSADPWTLYLYAIKSPATKEKYLMRLEKFLNFLNFQGRLEEKARVFAEREDMIVHWPLTVSLNSYNFRRNVLTVRK